MQVSINRSTPKSSILMGLSLINHPFWVPPFWETPKMILHLPTEAWQFIFHQVPLGDFSVWSTGLAGRSWGPPKSGTSPCFMGQIPFIQPWPFVMLNSCIPSRPCFMGQGYHPMASCISHGELPDIFCGWMMTMLPWRKRKPRTSHSPWPSSLNRLLPWGSALERQGDSPGWLRMRHENGSLRTSKCIKVDIDVFFFIFFLGLRFKP